MRTSTPPILWRPAGISRAGQFLWTEFGFVHIVMNYNNMVCRWYVNIEDRATRKMVAMNIAGEQVWITGG
ncbi:MAG TPA: hypothetical protein DEP10_10015, partial [Alphaproteobacteria bacterium]|nr:hypothetical protein [Alphaproteobacteria bacterium]